MFKMLWIVVLSLLWVTVLPPCSMGARDLILSKNQIAKPEATAKSRVVEAYGKLPLDFEVNRGQADRAVRFLSTGIGYRLALTSTGAVIAFNDVDEATARKGRKTPNPRSNVIRMRWERANQDARIDGLGELEGRSHYFIGNDPDRWQTDIPLYSKVRYGDIYPGIDLIYFGNQRQLEYDLVVAPGGDPGAIRLVIEEAEGIRLDEGGNLVLRSGGRELIQHAPIIYQEVDGKKQFIKGGYVLDALGSDEDKRKARIGFKIDKFDTKKPLIIDPVLVVYSTYLGGSNNDVGFGIAVDSSGSAYITGYTNSTDFPMASPGTSTGYDVFATKLNPSGSALVYSAYFGGSAEDCGFGIAVDNSGSAYITGYTNSTNFPTVSPSRGSNAGPPDAFVTKLSPNGSALVYSTYLGGSDEDAGYGIALDGSGNAYVTGETWSINFPTKNPIYKSYSGWSDVFITKVNPSGTELVYSTYLEGSDEDYSWAIAVDSSGSAYITGETWSTDFSTANPLYWKNSGESDVFITKVNPSGTELDYSTYYGGSGKDYGRSIAVDSSGNAYITGYTSSTNFPTTGPIQGSNAGPPDAFVLKLNAAGSASDYSTYLGGDGEDFGYGIAVDKSGNAYVAGYTNSTNFPTEGPIQGANGSYDIFVTQLNSAGSALAYSTYLGGSGKDFAYSIALDSSGNAYITGETWSADFPTASSFQASFAGKGDAFITKLSLSDEPYLIGSWTVPLAQTCRAVGKRVRCTLKGTLTVTNMGNKDASASHVAFYLSDNDAHSEENMLLKNMNTGKIKPNTSKAVKLTYTFQTGQNAEGKYIISVIGWKSSAQGVDETNIMPSGLIQ
jgi:hypothetical protein